MIPLSFILTCLIAHWVFDFVLQTDTMACSKSHDISALFDHVCRYTVGLGAMSLFIMIHDNTNGAIWLIVNTVAHFVTDYFTSKVSAHYYTNNNRHAFFVTVGLDQFLHISTMLVTYYIFSL